MEPPVTPFKRKQHKMTRKISRESFLQKANTEYAQLLKDPEFTKQEQEELEAWDATLLDGQDK